MSTCISREGEFGEHEQGEEEFVCGRCFVVDEEAMRGEIARLRAGESDEPNTPEAVPTPGQWIRLWNENTPEKRLEWAERIIADGDTAYRCRIYHGELQERAEAAEAKAEVTAGPDSVQSKAIAAIRAGKPTTYRVKFAYGIVDTTTGENLHAFESVFIGNDFQKTRLFDTPPRPPAGEVAPPAERRRVWCGCGCGANNDEPVGPAEGGQP